MQPQIDMFLVIINKKTATLSQVLKFLCRSVKTINNEKI